MIARYRGLLESPGALRLLTASVVGRLPLGMFPLAVLLLTNEQVRSLSAGGAAVGAAALASALTTPVKAHLLIRSGIRPVILGSAGSQTMLLVALVLVARSAQVLPIVLAAAACGAVQPPTSACARGLWPQVAPNLTARDAAYALDATSQELIWTAGPLFVTVTASAVSPTAAMLLTAAVGLGGNAWFASSPLCTRDVTAGRRVDSGGSPLGRRPMRMLLGTIVLTGLMAGALEVGLPALAIHLGEAGAGGALLALWSLGSMGGGIVYGARSWTTSLVTRYVALLIALAACTALLALARTLGVALLLSFVAGIGQAPLLTSQFSLVNAFAPPGGVTTAFTWSTAALVIGISAGSTLAGAIAHSDGVATPFLAAAAAAIVAAAGSMTLRSELTAAPGASYRAGA